MLVLLVTNGTVTFDLNGKTYTITGPARNEHRSDGCPNRAGSRFETVHWRRHRNGSIFWSGRAAAIGFLTVSTGGRLGDGTLNPDLFVGNPGTGTFTVEDNGLRRLGLPDHWT